VFIIPLYDSLVKNYVAYAQFAMLYALSQIKSKHKYTYAYKIFNKCLITFK